MAHFLRDQQVSSLTINEDGLVQISSTFAARAASLNAGRPEGGNSDNEVFLSYVIRFDSKGYRVFSIDDLQMYFQHAKTVERVIWTVETGQSIRTGRQVGTLLELRLDEREPSTCTLTVTADDRDWVDASFSAVLETIAKSKNRSRWARTAWTAFGVQLVGVTLGFLLSLWAAAKVAPKLAIENAFVFSFLFVLLIFSNTWTYLNQQIMRLIGVAFPNVKFLRHDKDRLHWLLQAVIGGIVGAAVLYALGQGAAFLLDLLGALVAKNK